MGVCMMSKYARIVDGQIFEFFETDGDIAQMFHPDLTWVNVTGVSSAPDHRWTAMEVDGAWSFAKPVVVPPTDAELRASATGKRDALLEIASEATTGCLTPILRGFWMKLTPLASRLMPPTSWR
jgi:hypothetical protein